MKPILIGAALAGAFAWLAMAADIPPLNDGSEHGDPVVSGRGWMEACSTARTSTDGNSSIPRSTANGW